MQALLRASLNEAFSVARCMVAYPQGFLNAGLRTGVPSGDQSLDTPVLLLHGYGHNSSAWFMLRKALKQAGFTSVHTMNYNPVLQDIPAIAEKLSDRVEAICTLTGSDKVNLVGHSLGGVVSRWYVQQMDGDHRVNTAITLASPHKGTIAAFVPPGSTARECRPNSWVMRRLNEGVLPTSVRWVAFYGDADALVQPIGSGRIDVPALNARNVLIPGMGHMGMLLSGDVVNQVVEELLRPPTAAADLPLFQRRLTRASAEPTPEAVASLRVLGT
ncbi:MAG TPA: alpha/beta fold hydrolase [Acidimicrobiales bacterium]|nr:alpha/beta fold hydrolase [Acidimicrobiales bacterium]